MSCRRTHCLIDYYRQKTHCACCNWKKDFFFHNFRLHSSSSRLRTAFFFDDSKLLRQLECKRKNSSTKFNRWAQQLCIQCTDIFHIFHLMAIFYIHKMKYILFVPICSHVACMNVCVCIWYTFQWCSVLFFVCSFVNCSGILWTCRRS